MKFAHTSHTLLVCLALMPLRAFAIDDHGDTCGTASPMLTDGTLVGSIIDPVTDEDWLSFSAVAGHRYDVTTYEFSASFYFEVKVLGPDCATEIADWSYGGSDERSVVTPTTDTYYIRITSLSSAYVGYLGLGLTDRGPNADDHSGRQAEATPILADGSVDSGTTNYTSDVDWFAFPGTAQHAYQLEIRALPGATTYGVLAEFYAGAGESGTAGWV
ncbi:MAG TPA: hypothetical protein VMV81_08870, partial [Phycisphaerae bacterium]|nr:hypothetical protein [Phycisphaerae bacterium]